MNALTESIVDSLAPNSAAAKNGRDLVKKNKLTKLHKSEDDTLLFGECAGSGASAYSCSADFKDGDTPLVRCNCPSRQFPCKHGLALLYAYAGGAEFTVAEVPAELEAKREKAEKRTARKAAQEETAAGVEAPVKPKKVNKTAWVKKIQAQLEGLELLEKLTQSLIRSGLGTADKRVVTQLREGVKSLGNSYLPGAQNELRGLALALEQASKQSDAQEQVYSSAVEQLLRIHALIRKGRPYLEAKLQDPELRPDVETAIEEWLGHAWQLSELQAHGLVRTERELLQLAFASYDDPARAEYVDVGYWLELGSGEVHRALNYRPYKAAKHIRSEDSNVQLVRAGELYVYPGTWNRRIRMEQTASSQVGERELELARQSAESSVAEAVKKVRGELKDPLGNKSPVLLLHAASVLATADGQPVLVDDAGGKLQLADIPDWQPTTELLRLVPASELEDAVFVLMFRHAPERQRLEAQPLAIIHATHITRL